MEVEAEAEAAEELLLVAMAKVARDRALVQAAHSQTAEAAAAAASAERAQLVRSLGEMESHCGGLDVRLRELTALADSLQEREAAAAAASELQAGAAATMAQARLGELREELREATAARDKVEVERADTHALLVRTVAKAAAERATLITQVSRSTAMEKLRVVTLKGLATENGPENGNEAQRPNFRVERVHVSAGYNREEGNRRASRNGRVSLYPTRIP